MQLILYFATYHNSYFDMTGFIYLDLMGLEERHQLGVNGEDFSLVLLVEIKHEFRDVRLVDLE